MWKHSLSNMQFSEFSKLNWIIAGCMKMSCVVFVPCLTRECICVNKLRQFTWFCLCSFLSVLLDTVGINIANCHPVFLASLHRVQKNQENLYQFTQVRADTIYGLWNYNYIIQYQNVHSILKFNGYFNVFLKIFTSTSKSIFKSLHGY